MWGQLARSALKGTAITIGSATVSCCLALYVEKAAHRALYTVCPDKYADVDQALGLEQWELDAVRRHQEATLASDLLPVTVHENQEKVFTDEDKVPAVKNTVVPPRYDITVSDKSVFTCALTS